MRRPSPALVLSALALVVASSGTAVAAGKYLITSQSQIAPSVLATLHAGSTSLDPSEQTWRTRLNVNNGGAVTYQTNGFAQLATLGTFAKHRANTAVTVAYDEISATDTLAAVCDVQLRVDGVNDLGGTGFSGTDGVVTTYQPDEPTPQVTTVFMQSVFLGLPVGTHTITVWGNTDLASSGCYDDAGGFDRSVLITESR